ncbi:MULTISPECIES: FAD-dependent 5-carboxymethylaminomethyl-2-thiouridine(34) oxidoreductase MnmC [unclassified Acinetobacter]|uniref:FAD-dependent 5-carboxymethylaminomethyl-2-thiouridine(34) oxidoreductase MnmC n=1 Tax=unclassified Acinetobacter TaxID=196816 RepID=UPI00244AB806|nr:MULTISPECIES: FAD-dependent 5-carboxymethylaminomethyl-2-thiouridine(34) oxidoreductase MnmC [unclassified Acinetobacter]MDH0032631.1 FAD-dependent 5-carboxymethylaminomethyl-2-thiouridine(34) oxidoreductase MnmC [Acinetobacter sp. GD04021]MDH0886939.1 FAD-dependent 5-carboxymethylaminomethyl-2-thiouridine(34) oxidoreductase MnmC [Acinetobacter sp. GD03873]MDH1083248.1 FAD-dependent 5-carboxymethylaminomethyl-2-thiouridine(34) oxidoreductase MnmC [Acinetobacter sp. GD03983]MDH2190255.1 FAD-d
MSQSAKLQTAELDWELVDGIEVPISRQFGDVYFSKDNGLLETRHVFLNGNDLIERLSQLNDYQYFCVGETGFGTGLNILTLWQLWQQVRPNNHSHLHAISVEKFPLSKADLIRALNVWTELEPLAEKLIEQYPLPIAGCHRLSFPEERFSIDLWLGDAQDIFPIIPKTQAVNAWFLDGFAPSCNPDMWQENVLNHIVRLSEFGTTFASFSVAGVLKRGLKQHGIQISRPRGFGHKREMLKAIWLDTSQTETQSQDSETTIAAQPKSETSKQRKIAIIGAGIAGLSTAWAFAQRGHQVTIYEQNGPLSGASGNPLALLNPKLCPIEQAHEHLMTLSWQHALNFYPRFKAFKPIQVQQIALKNADELLGLVEQYPENVLSENIKQADNSIPQTEFPSLTLHQAGAISPHQLRDEILQHPNIILKIAKISALKQIENQTEVWQEQQLIATADHVIVCCARQSAELFENYPILKPIRGQVSWVENTKRPLSLNQAYSYGGYCTQLDASHLLLGASFYPNRDDAEVLPADHVHNYELIHSVFPEYTQQLPSVDTWQGRASVRAQSLDYFPLVGKMQDHEEIYTLAGLGSKGFMFAPLCSEILAALILGELCPVSQKLLDKLNPQRFKKKIKVKKPYYSA